MNKRILKLVGVGVSSTIVACLNGVGVSSEGAGSGSATKTTETFQKLNMYPQSTAYQMSSQN